MKEKVSGLTRSFRFFDSWFHCFDAAVIIASFGIDLLEHGIEEEIASLVVILRLWRFIKIVDEFSVEAAEQVATSRTEASTRLIKAGVDQSPVPGRLRALISQSSFENASLQ